MEVDNEALERNLERQLGWVRSAETRLNLILPLGTLLFGGIAAKIDQVSHTCPPLFWSAWLSIFLIALSIVFAAVSIFPRTTGPSESNVFFGTISRISVDDFSERVNGASSADYRADLLRQIHRNSEIATVRFQWMKYSMWSLLLSFPFWGFAASKLY